jgi:hypothetical protein
MPREGANQHHAVEDAQWVDQAGCGVHHDAGAGGGAHYAWGRVQPDFDWSRTEGLGSPQDEQPKVGPEGAAPRERRKSKYLHQWLRARAHEKGTGAPGGAEEGCRRQARRASRVGRTSNQINEKIDEIIDFAEIREFIDMPVQSYFPGMTVRLV